MASPADSFEVWFGVLQEIAARRGFSAAAIASIDAEAFAEYWRAGLSPGEAFDSDMQYVDD